MKSHIIDTNALISFVTDRSPVQQNKIANVLDLSVRLKVKVICPQNVLTEFVYVMDTVYGRPKSEIRDIVKAFVNLPGVEIIHEISLETLFKLWPEKVPDYGDAIIAALCQDTKGSSVATFDKKFRAKLKRLGIPAYSFDNG